MPENEVFGQAEGGTKAGEAGAGSAAAPVSPAFWWLAADGKERLYQPLFYGDLIFYEIWSCIFFLIARIRQVTT